MNKDGLEKCGRCNSFIYTFQDRSVDEQDNIKTHTGCNLQIEIRRWILDTSARHNKDLSTILEALLCAGEDELARKYTNKEEFESLIANAGADIVDAEEAAQKMYNYAVFVPGSGWIRSHMKKKKYYHLNEAYDKLKKKLFPSGNFAPYRAMFASIRADNSDTD